MRDTKGQMCKKNGWNDVTYSVKMEPGLAFRCCQNLLLIL